MSFSLQTLPMNVMRIGTISVAVLLISYSCKDIKSIYCALLLAQSITYLFLFTDKTNQMQDEASVSVVFFTFIFILQNTISQKFISYIFTKHSKILNLTDSVILMAGLVQTLYGFDKVAEFGL